MYSYFPTEEDNEDPPFCEDCGQPMEADADVDISDETGRPYPYFANWRGKNS